jgi:hypothetical protein
MAQVPKIASGAADGYGESFTVLQKRFVMCKGQPGASLAKGFFALLC